MSFNLHKRVWQAAALLIVLLVVAGLYIYKNGREESGVSVPDDALPKLVELGSETCPPCLLLAPVLADLKEEFQGRLIVETIDINKERELALKYHEKHPIRVTPTLILYDADGKEIWSAEGYQEKRELKQVLAVKAGLR